MGHRFLAVAVLCALAGPAARGDAPPRAARPPKAAKGPSPATLELYQAKCQSCHMPDGNAPLEMMNLADAKWLHGSKQADVVKVIAEGVPNTAMLPFKEQLTAAQIADLAAYVRSFSKPAAARKGKTAK